MCKRLTNNQLQTKLCAAAVALTKKPRQKCIWRGFFIKKYFWRVIFYRRSTLLAKL